MIELGILLVIIVFLWKFSGSIDSTATATEESVKVWGESVIKDAVIERQELVAEFNEDIKRLKSTNPDFEIKSSDEFLKDMKVK